MSQNKKQGQSKPSSKLQPTASKVSTVYNNPRNEPNVVKSRDQKVRVKQELLFTKLNFKWMLIGIGVMVLGYILMAGGKMPDPNIWEPERIYSFRRITLAPIVILIGIGIEVYAIFFGARKSSL